MSKPLPSQAAAESIYASMSEIDLEKYTTFGYRRLQTAFGVSSRVALALAKLLKGRDPAAAKVSATKQPDIPDGRYTELDDGRYLFEWKEGEYPRSAVISEEGLQSMLRAYTKDGGDESMHVVALQHGLTRREFSKIKSLYGATKDHEPFTLREMEGRELEDLAETQLIMKRRKLLRKVEREDYSRTKEAARKWYALEADVLDPVAEVVQGLLGRQPQEDDRAATWEATTSVRAYIAAYQGSDLHLGLGVDDGSYDRKIAVDRFMTGLAETIAHGRSAWGEPEYFLLYVGGDVAHVDNTHAATSSMRHHQDMDGTPDTLIQDIAELYMTAVETLLSLGLNVRLAVVPGNHDEMLSRAFISMLWAAFKDDPRVSFGNLTGSHSYELYGNNALIAHHGHGERTAAALGGNLESWLRSKRKSVPFLYAITGNLHHLAVKEDGGCTLLQQPSPAPADRYHKLNGYDTSRRATMGMYFDRDEGLLALRYVGF